MYVHQSNAGIVSAPSTMGAPQTCAFLTRVAYCNLESYL